MAPAGSRKMLGRAGWLSMATDEEARAYLQARLEVLSRLMFWSFIVLIGSMLLLYRRYPSYEPRLNWAIYLVATIGLVILSIVWRGILVRRELSMRALQAIDVFYAASTGATFACAACLSYDLKPGAWANMQWTCFMVLLRTIVIPSSGRRTAVVGTITFAPMLAAALVLGLCTEQDIPGPAYIASDVVISAVAILLATIGSRIIYGLRHQVHQAMRLGQYTLERKIGEGGNGTVYRAHHAMLRRPTAVKLMLPERIDADTLDRFEREVQHMSQLTHPNTVAVFDYGRSPDGVFYYAMEYLDGIDLEQLVRRFGPQPQDRVVAILSQVCGALQEAHHRGIIHRDIKPANIILCERGDVPDVAKVVDFGLAKEIMSQDARRGILGTPAYLAPEAVTDPDAIGPPADLYALGAVGYFLLTGARVFEGKTAVDVCVQHVTADPVPPSTRGQVSPELERVLLQCLAKRPEQRPGSARALAMLLRAVPSAGDWSDESSRSWWLAFPAQRTAPSSTVATKTITVDVVSRAA
jgi:eukaryotic-like serine/threonine-protein kinase